MAELHEQYAQSLLRYLTKLIGNNEDASDCLQSTFAILQTKGGSCAKGARKAWLFRVAHNEALQLFRRHKAKSFGDSENRLDDLSSSSGSPIDEVLRIERLGEVKQAVESLSEELQVIVMMRVSEGLKFREIAEQLNIPLGTALARMQAALKQLDAKLRD